MIESCRYTLSRISKVVEQHGGGLYKGINENRKLLELLWRETPELLSAFPQITVWLTTLGKMLMAVEDAVPVDQQRFAFPRIDGKNPQPWPAAHVPKAGM